jgi:hypothetical protein
MRGFENRMNAVWELRELEGEIGVGGQSPPLDFYFCADSSLASAKVKRRCCMPPTPVHRGDARDTTRRRTKLAITHKKAHKTTVIENKTFVHLYVHWPR